MSKGLEVTEANIVETAKFELRDPLVVLGFVGPGLVGGISVTHIANQVRMAEIAHIRSRYLPSAVVFIDGKLRHPFRVYSSDKGDLCAIVCEVPLHSEGHYPISSVILDWIEEKGGKELVVFEGIAVRGIPKNRKSFCVAELEKCKECEERGVEMLSAGIIRGIVGSILNECLTRKITGIALLTPTFAFIPDPEGAAILINAFNKIYGLGIETEELMNQEDEIKQKLKEVAESSQKMVESEEKRGAPERLYI